MFQYQVMVITGWCKGVHGHHAFPSVPGWEARPDAGSSYAWPLKQLIYQLNMAILTMFFVVCLPEGLLGNFGWFLLSDFLKILDGLRFWKKSNHFEPWPVITDGRNRQVGDPRRPDPGEHVHCHLLLSCAHVWAHLPTRVVANLPHILPGWWFGTFFIFPYIGKTFIFFRGVQTTNQLLYLSDQGVSLGPRPFRAGAGSMCWTYSYSKICIYIYTQTQTHTSWSFIILSYMLVSFFVMVVWFTRIMHVYIYIINIFIYA